MKSIWTQQEDDIIIKLYPTTRTDEVALLVNKTFKQVSKRAFDLGVNKTKAFITNQKRVIATKNRKCKLCDNKHEGLGFCHKHYALFKRGTITIDGVGYVRPPGEWSEDQIILLKNMYSISTLNELLVLLSDKSRGAIRSMSAKLDLKKDVATGQRCHKTKMTSESKIKMSCSLRKIDRADFEGFSTTINHRIRQTDEYKEWRSLVYKRDNYTCKKCDVIGSGNLHAHHLNPLSNLIRNYQGELTEYAPRDSYFYDVNNGITLCDRCHSDVHGNEGLVNMGKINGSIKK